MTKKTKGEIAIKNIHREPLTSDLVFKAVYGSDSEESKQIIIKLLNLVLKREQNPIVDVLYVNPFSINQDIKEKTIIMDIKVKTNTGEMIDVEMQIGALKEYIKRTIYYACKQLTKDLLHGDNYEDMKPSILISFVNGKLFKNKKEYYSVYTLRENTYGEQLSNALELHYIELDKINWKDRNVDDLNALEQLGAYLKCSGDPDERDFVEALVDNGTEVIGMTDNVLLKVSEDERLQSMRESREMFLMQMSWEKQRAQREGHAEGRAAGRAEGKSEAHMEDAKEMKLDGVPLEKIAQYTKLPLETIKAL